MRGRRDDSRRRLSAVIVGDRPLTNKHHDKNHHGSGDPPGADEGTRKSGSNAPNRRGAIVWMTWISGTVAAVVASVPILGFLFGPLHRREDQWTIAGQVDQFPIGEVRLIKMDNPLGKASDTDLGQVSAYVKRFPNDKFQVLSIICTHLGCPVNWFPEAKLFMCPCHGGAYYDDGSKASGPPPENLYEYEWRIANGSLEVKIGHLPTLCDPA